MKLEQKDDYYRATVSIDVRNDSNDSWNELLFYFEHYLQPFDIKVTVNGDEAETRQVQSRFAIDLDDYIRPNDRAVVELSYQFYPGETGSVQAIRLGTLCLEIMFKGNGKCLNRTILII